MKYYLTAVPLSWAARGWLRAVSGSCIVRLHFSISGLATLCHRELQGRGGGACLAPTFLRISMWIESHLVGSGDAQGLSSSLQHPWEKAGHNGVSVTTPGMEGREIQAPWNSLISQPRWLNELQLSLKKKMTQKPRWRLMEEDIMCFSDFHTHACQEHMYLPTNEHEHTTYTCIHTQIHKHTVHILDWIL